MQNSSLKFHVEVSWIESSILLDFTFSKLKINPLISWILPDKNINLNDLSSNFYI